jgi:class 3 adenylate cyclase
VDREELVRAGLYDPDAPNAPERLALLDWLADHGASIDQMLRSDAMGSLSSAAGDAAVRPGRGISLDELCEQSGLTVHQVRAVLLNAGTAPAGGDEPVFLESDVATFRAFKLASEIFGIDAVLQFVRVLGSSMARVAEAAISLFQLNVEANIDRTPRGALELAKANYEAVLALDLVPQAMAGLFRLHMEQGIRRSRAAYFQPDPYGSRRLCVGFVDLVGFTALTRQLPEVELAGLIERFEGNTNEIVTRYDGRVVKYVGDEVMYIAVTASAACEIALEIVDAFDGPDSTVQPHGGLAIGGLVARGGDYYGPIVNLASRIADIAVPTEVLVTEEVKDAGESASIEFSPAGRRMLKGFAEPVELWAVTRSRRGA